MTPDNDIDRVLDRWLTEGPKQMPGRFLDDTLDRIDRMPSGHLVGLRTRARTARPDPRLAVAAAVVLVVAAAMSFLVLRGPAVGVSPTPTPAVVPSSSAPAFIDPSVLAGKWTSVGGRQYPIGTTPVDSAAIKFGVTSLSINGFKGWIENGWSNDGPAGHIAIDMRSSQSNLTGEHWSCLPGQTGHYIVGLSPAGSTMTLTMLDDACEARATILAGDWTRWPCPNPDSTCAPELEPGGHAWSFVPNIDPNEPSPPPTYLRGYSAEVPAGWSRLDYQNILARPNDPGTMAMALTLDVAPHSQTPDCDDAVEPGVGNSATALADWLTTLPGLVTTTPAPVTIGGFDGWMLDLSVAPTWTRSCAQYVDGSAPVVLTFTDPIQGSGVFIRDSVQGDAQSRVVLLDVGPGHNLLIEIAAPDKASWDDLVGAAMPIVDSLEFTP